MKQKEGIKHSIEDPVVQDASAESGELLSLKEASQILKVHPNTLRNWERAGLIPVVRVGPRRDRRFPKHAVHGFANGERTSPVKLPEKGKLVPALSIGPGGALEEPAHVIVNVPAGLPARTIRFLLAGLGALVFVVFLFALFGATNQPSTFAIRPNPPFTLLSDDFETYEAGALPRPVWNTIGLWKVEQLDGQRILRGEEFTDNPLKIFSHAYTGSSAWNDYKMKFDARVVSGEKRVVALVDYLDQNNYYRVTFEEKEVTVSIVHEGKERVLGKAPMEFTNPEEWHTFTIDLFDEELDLSFDGKRLLGVKKTDLIFGKVGFAVADQVVDFDHLEVLESNGG